MVILISPPVPSLPGSTPLSTKLSVSKETLSLALIITLPVFPCPRVLLMIREPSLADKELAVILISPPFVPATVLRLRLRIELFVREIFASLLRLIFPANKPREPI